MTRDFTDESPQVYARVGGVLYLIIIVAGLAGQLFIRDPLVISGNAASTAVNIAATTTLWRIGIAGDSVMHLCDVGLMLVFYVLLRPVSRNLALLVVLFNLVQTAMLVANKTGLLLPLFLLGDASVPEGVQPGAASGPHLHFSQDPRLRLRFRPYLLRRGVHRPRPPHRPFGLPPEDHRHPDGDSGAPATSPTALPSSSIAPLASRLFPWVLLPPFVAEASLALWLLIKGVDVPKWIERRKAEGCH